MQRYYQAEMECASPEKMRQWQNERLVEQVRHVWENVPAYRRRMEEKGVTPDDIRSLEDLSKLPFLTKDDLRDEYPYGFLGVPIEDAVRIQSTSGTTGKRVVAFYTQPDLDIWDECCARSIVAAGGTREDVVQVCYGYGLFTGGPGLNGGSHKVGSLTLPMSSGNTERQIQFLTDLGATILCCTPSYAAFIGETVRDKGVRDQLVLKSGIFGAEAWSEGMREEVQDLLGLEAFDIYGLTEITGPGVSFECDQHAGLHINEDHFIPEIIDPATGEVLPDGEVGELVFTCITKRGFPLLRYRTRDLTSLNREKCACGRTLVRMGRLQGRTDDMLIVRGVNVFPSQIEAVIVEQGFGANNYQITVTRERHSDRLLVEVEIPQDMAPDRTSDVGTMEARLAAGLQSMLGIRADVRLVAPHTIARSEGKATRVIDKRRI